MTISKHIDDITEDLTIKNLIKATEQGKCMWIKVNHEEFTQYQHILHINGSKTLHVRVYKRINNYVNLNIYLSQSDGRKIIQILTSQKQEINDLIKSIQDNKGFNEHVY